MYLRRRMLSDTLQHIDEVVVWIDGVQPTGHQHALHDTDVLGAEFGPTEPIFATHPNHPQCALQMVGIDRHVRVAEIDFECKRVALPPRIFRIMLAHSLALTSEDKRGERRSEVGILDEAG